MTGKYQASLFVEQLTLPKSIGQATVSPSSIRTLLTEGKGSVASFDFTLNAYRGCTFGCAYCYAPSFEHRPEMAEAWGSWVEVKETAMDLLAGADLRAKSIFMSSVTDPYQPVEAKVGLTRQIVESLAEKQAHLVVQTRSPLVARDIDLLKRFDKVRVNMSVPTHSDEVRRIYEPSAPSIQARLRTVRRLREAGLEVSVCISPMIPVLDAMEFAQMVNESHASRVTASWFHSSTKPFSANTRAGAVALNTVQEWNYDRFFAVCEVLQKECPAFTSARRAFGPVARG